MHTQARYCHPSLGMKIHMNIQDVVLMEGVYMSMDNKSFSTFGDWTKKLLDADTPGLVVFMLSSCCGGGVAQFSGPCNFGANNRWSSHGAIVMPGNNIRNYRSLLYAAHVT